jgi:hypothetical protein
MGKIYSPPKEIGECPRLADYFTGGKFSRDEMFEAEKEWTESLRRWCKENSQDEFAGEIVKEPVADGYAMYMVLSTKPVKLIHLPLGDAWDFRWAHRWTAPDIIQMVELERNFARVMRELEESK